MGDLIAFASNYLHNFAWLRFYRTDVGNRFNYEELLRKLSSIKKWPVVESFSYKISYKTLDIYLIYW